MAFFDTHDSGALLARVVTDTNAIQEARRCAAPAALRPTSSLFSRHHAAQRVSRARPACCTLTWRRSRVPRLQALSSKCPNLIHHGSAGVIGIIIGLARGWQMALVVCATLPLMGARQRAGVVRCGSAALRGLFRNARRVRLRLRVARRRWVCHGDVDAVLEEDRVGRIRRRLRLRQGDHLCVCFTSASQMPSLRTR
jgi:hypothetical protein